VLATNLRAGQQVEYRQGRGTFAAKVVRIEDKRGAAVLERLSDGKRLRRPLAKVYPASAQPGAKERK
jgi:hypothetical protein